MKIQYQIDPSYNSEETLQVAGILLGILLKTFKALKASGRKFESTDLVFWPLNAFQIGKTKKLLLMSSQKGQVALEYMDEKFLKALEEAQLKVSREVVS